MAPPSAAPALQPAPGVLKIACPSVKAAFESERQIKAKGIAIEQIQIRNLPISPPLLLAPMAGLTHSALRQLIQGFGGVGLLSTEMLRATALPSENPLVSPYLVRTPAEKPVSYQVLASTDREIGPAVDALHKLGADAVDLNMGCPRRAVTNTGAGFALMENPEKGRRIVNAARKRTNLPLTAKIRLGTEPDEVALRDFVTMLQGEGIDMLTVHARLKRDTFGRRPRWEWIGRIKEWVTIPVTVNGGIFSIQDARDCLRVSGANGLMLARGAAIKPWLFAEIARDVYGCDIAAPEISLPVVYETFIDLLTGLFRPERRLGRLKEFTHYFAQNYKFGLLLRSAVQGSVSMEEARERAGLFFENNCSPS